MNEPHLTVEPQTHPFAEVEVPEGIRLARAAFLRDFATLMANYKTRGKYVCYHREALVAVASTYVGIVRETVARNIPEDASLIFKVAAGVDATEREIAEEAEIDPSWTILRSRNPNRSKPKPLLSNFPIPDSHSPR